MRVRRAALIAVASEYDEARKYVPCMKAIMEHANPLSVSLQAGSTA